VTPVAPVPGRRCLKGARRDRDQRERHLVDPGGLRPAQEGRTEIVKRIEAAREEGDLRENGGYHAAKDEQGKREARIRQLQQLLDSAEVGEAPKAPSGVVAPGTVVTAKVGGETMRFLLGSREVAGDGIEVYSEKSPLGAAINGRHKGETSTFAAPNGNKVDVEIVDTEPFAG
jgi:transcription elongation factor GreA